MIQILPSQRSHVMPRRYQYSNCFSRSNRRSALWIAPLLAVALLPLRLTWADDRTGLATEDASSSASVDSATGDTAGSVQRATNEKIETLIRQLGHPRFTIRRSAASELRQIGAEAFDLLNAASNDSDPEVAASAR